MAASEDRGPAQGSQLGDRPLGTMKILRSAGGLTILFFTVKGLLWLLVPLLAAVFLGR